MMKAQAQTQKISAVISKSILKSYRPSSVAIKAATNLIKKYDNFILTTHIKSDADGIGSQIGLYYLLKALKKKCVIINSEAPPNYLDFITNGTPIHVARELSSQAGASSLEGLKLTKKYFGLILDSSEEKRSQEVLDILKKEGIPWGSIDHHDITKKKNFCVDNSYAATAEMVWDLYKTFKVKINSIAAHAMYTGIVADSGNFRFPKTSLRTHLAGGDLIASGVHSDFIYRKVYESNPMDRLIYMGRIYKNLFIDREHGIAMAFVTKKTKKGLELGDSANEGIVNQFLAANGINVAVLATQTEDNLMKASLRSIGDIDVSKVAQQFNGGGHKNAAGLKANLPFKKAKKVLLEALQQAVIITK